MLHEQVDDLTESKPVDWVESEKMPDPAAVKPADWDEDQPRTIPDLTAVRPEGWAEDAPAEIPDPDASKPEDWLDDEVNIYYNTNISPLVIILTRSSHTLKDGEWEAPTIPNPICEQIGCGPWSPPQIPNPLYKGRWTAPLIDNPDYKGRTHPHIYYSHTAYRYIIQIYMQHTFNTHILLEMYTLLPSLPIHEYSYVPTNTHTSIYNKYTPHYTYMPSLHRSLVPSQGPKPGVLRGPDPRPDPRPHRSPRNRSVDDE